MAQTPPSQSPADAAYSIRIADHARDRAAILSLWGQAFPAPQLHPIKYDWCYGQTPQGDGRLYVLHTQPGGVIGVQGIVPRRWWFRGAQLDTGIYADLVVDPHYRSVGPALALVRGVVAREEEQAHIAMLYGFPNRKSEALLRRAGYRKLADVTRYARPLRVGLWLARKGLPAFLARGLGRLVDLGAQLRTLWVSKRVAQNRHGVSLATFDARFDELWQRIAAQDTPMVIRDSAYLNWRFGNDFAGRHHVFGLLTDAGQLDAYLVYCVIDGMVVVQDFLAVDETSLEALCNLFVRAMYRQGHNGIALEFSGPTAVVETLRRCRFSARDSQPVYSLGHTDHGPQPDDLPYFTSADRDQ